MPTFFISSLERCPACYSRGYDSACQAPPSLDREYLQACNPACPAPACGCRSWGSCTRRDLVSRGGALVSAYHQEKVRGVARIMSTDRSSACAPAATAATRESVAPITTRRWETKPSTTTSGLHGSSPADKGCGRRSIAGPRWQGGAARCPLLQVHFVERAEPQARNSEPTS